MVRFTGPKSIGPGGPEGSQKSTERKPVYLKDYERQRLMERGSMAGLSDSEGEEEEEEEGEGGLTHQQEQEALKVSFKEAAATEQEGEEDLLIPRYKTEEDKVGGRSYRDRGINDIIMTSSRPGRSVSTCSG